MAGRSLFFFGLCVAGVISGIWVAVARSPLSDGDCRATAPGKTRTITDATGRPVTLPEPVHRAICSGPGCLRLLAYLGAHESVVAVDSIEKRGSPVDMRPYALAFPEFGGLPLFGEFRGNDNPELIVGLDPRPQAIFKTFLGPGQHPDRLESQTGVPVVTLNYGNLTDRRPDLDQALRLMGAALNRSERAEEVIAFFDACIADLAARTADIAAEDRPTCYVGGIALRGALGFRSTDPNYAPFAFTAARNVAAGLVPPERGVSHAIVAKEQIVAWDPEVVFVDLATVRVGASGGGVAELGHDPAYRDLRAVREGRVFGVLPHNSYAENFGSVLANAYFVAKTLHPERLADVDPIEKADEIYTFLLGAPVFARMSRRVGRPVFAPISFPEQATP